MRFIATNTLIVLASLNCWGAAIFGLVHVNERGLFLKHNSYLYQMQGATVDVSSDLSRLRTGDYVAFEGYIAPEHNKIFVQSVDWVGLGRILGNWKTGDGKVVSFDSFTLMSIRNHKPGEIFYNFQKSHLDSTTLKLSYRISPSVGSSWSLFLSDNKGNIKVGRILLLDKTLIISLYDAETGQISKTIQLSRQSFSSHAYL